MTQSELFAAPADRVASAIAGQVAVADLTVDEVATACAQLNDAYRRGRPLADDPTYEHVFLAELRRRAPDHPFLQVPEPEPEGAFSGDRYRHTVPMLSTDKAYGQDAIDAWLARVVEAAGAVGVAVEAVLIRVTGKIDGIATYRYPNALVTRGRNGYGTDISHILKIGVVGGDKEGAGELAVVQAYFDEQLAEQYSLEHPRNFVAGVASADERKDHHDVALAAGMVRVVSYGDLPAQEVGMEEFRANWMAIMRQAQDVPFLCDGAVAEVVNREVREELGATSRHHRYMLALKENAQHAEVVVRSIRLTTGRTGQITPTAFYDPVQMYGVTISRATGHACSHLAAKGLGVGARVSVCRSGGVIPTLVSIISPSADVLDLSKCPSCGGATRWDGAHLFCDEPATCVAQASRALQHFWQTLAVCNGFGPTTTNALVAAGITSPEAIYSLGAGGLVAAGISPGIAANLQSELDRSRREPISEAVFLAAFGIRHLGRGDSRRLLSHIALDQLGTVTPERIAAISGFGPITSPTIAASLAKTWPRIKALLDLGFNLEAVPRADAAAVDSPISGKTLVFTGTMTTGSRDDMEGEARRLGANVGGSVTGKTHFLVCGDKVGASKAEKAVRLGVKVISEAEYRRMLSC